MCSESRQDFRLNRLTTETLDEFRYKKHHRVLLLRAMTRQEAKSSI